MKKYFIVVCAIFIGTSALIPSLSSAQVSNDYSNEAYRKNDCVVLQNPNLRYKSKDAMTNGEVSALQSYLNSLGYLNSYPTGYFGPLTQQAVRIFQNSNGINPVSGYVGPITRAKIQDLTCNPIYTASSSFASHYSAPIISEVKGPTSLGVGQEGIWSVTASDSSGGPLSYEVLWEDEGSMLSRNSLNKVQQIATFSHTYSRSGKFIIQFSVTNQNGEKATQDYTVTVGGTSSVPTVVITANPSTINSGEISTIYWTSNFATSCSASWTSSTATSGSATVSPTSTTSYSITCTGSGGSTVQSVTVNVRNGTQVPAVTLSANPTSISSGGSSTLTWTSTNATSCSASWTSSTATSGSAIVSPTSTTSYSITCTGSGGSTTQSATVSVTPTLSIVYFSADPPTVEYGGSSTLSWKANNAAYCLLNGSQVTTSSSTSTGALTSSKTYTLICRNTSGGSDTKTVTVNVNNVNPIPTITLSANPTTVVAGGSSTLTWTSTNATSCSGYLGLNGTKPTSGSEVVNPTVTSYYGITCSGPGGNNFKSTVVYVNGGTQVPAVTLSANPTSISSGGSSTLTWTSTNATSCSASWTSSTATSGSAIVSPTSTTSYSITCTGSGGSTTQSATVNVNNTQVTYPVISGISGPQSLNVNQTGTWKINASDSGNGILSYTINWGDSNNLSKQTNNSTHSIQQVTTFTHNYGAPGIYVPVFTVTNSSGKTATTSINVMVNIP